MALAMTLAMTLTLPHPGMLPKDSIQLESIAGAYFFGDETRPMLQRIYGTAWETLTLTPNPDPNPQPSPPPSAQPSPSPQP